jgi:hypothetical protein
MREPGGLIPRMSFRQVPGTLRLCITDDCGHSVYIDVCGCGHFCSRERNFVRDMTCCQCSRSLEIPPESWCLMCRQGESLHGQSR